MSAEAQATISGREICGWCSLTIRLWIDVIADTHPVERGSMLGDEQLALGRIIVPVWRQLPETVRQTVRASLTRAWPSQAVLELDAAIESLAAVLDREIAAPDDPETT